MWLLTAALAISSMNDLGLSLMCGKQGVTYPIRVFNPQTQPSPTREDAITVMTLNLAHGRSNGFHQALQSYEQITRNLKAVAVVIDREKPDVVGLQEVDLPSNWSGGFSHVARLLSETNYHIGVSGIHAEGFGLQYGTAFLSNLSVLTTESLTFKPSPPTPPKGFTMIHIEHPAFKDGLDVISLHLDFLSATTRLKQINQLIESIQHRQRPMIIMGDFNCEWKKEDALRSLATKRHLKAYKPFKKHKATYPRSGKKLDWILLSSDLDFVSHKTIMDEISDHKAVIAVIKPAIR